MGRKARYARGVRVAGSDVRGLLAVDDGEDMLVSREKLGVSEGELWQCGRCCSCMVRLSQRQHGAAVVCAWLCISERECWRADESVRRASFGNAGGDAHGQTQPEAPWCCPGLCLTVSCGEDTLDKGR